MKANHVVPEHLCRFQPLELAQFKFLCTRPVQYVFQAKLGAFYHEFKPDVHTGRDYSLLERILCCRRIAIESDEAIPLLNVAQEMKSDSQQNYEIKIEMYRIRKTQKVTLVQITLNKIVVEHMF